MGDTDSWAGFGSEYIKAIEVVSKTDEYAIVDVESKVENNRKTLILSIERNETKKKFGCNATNLQAVQAQCKNSPREAIGRIITFNKVRTNNPQTKMEVDGLRLQFKPLDLPVDNVPQESGIEADGTI